MTSATDIANMALDVLKQGSIGDIDEQTPLGGWLRRNLPVTRDAIIEMADWDFARKRVSLSADTTGPSFGFRYSYSLPGDCVRVLPVTDTGSIEGRSIRYEKEGSKILCDKAAPLKVRYAARITNYTLWPATAQEALSSRLAMKMSHWLTGKTGYYEIALNMHREAMTAALLSNAVQGIEPEGEYTSFVDSRVTPLIGYHE